MKKPLNLYPKIWLSLIAALPVIVCVDIWLQYFFDIDINYGFFVTPWIVMGVTGLYVFFSRKKIVALIALSVIILCGVGYYNLVKERPTHSRRSINGGNYAIAVNAQGYSIIEDYGIAEKTVAVKASTLFFDPDSKTGVNQAYRVEVLKETPDSLYIEINSGGTRAVDSLKKRSLWERK